jgi:hypothetical protein
MFYEVEEIDELLKCKQCNTRYIQPRSLPCGEFICTNCLEKLIEEQSAEYSGKLKCCYCSEEHDMPERGFPISKHLEKLLAKTPKEISRGKIAEEFKSLLNHIKQETNDLGEHLENGIEKIRERSSLLKHQIQMKAESLCNEINKLNEEMLQDIVKYENECIESFKKNFELKEKVKTKISEFNSFHDKSSKCLSNLKIDDDQVSELIKRANQLRDDCKSLKNDLRVATNSHLKFKENENKLNSSIIGHLYFCFPLDSYWPIPSQKQTTELRDILCHTNSVALHKSSIDAVSVVPKVSENCKKVSQKAANLASSASHNPKLIVSNSSSSSGSSSNSSNTFSKSPLIIKKSIILDDDTDTLKYNPIPINGCFKSLSQEKPADIIADSKTTSSLNHDSAIIYASNSTGAVSAGGPINLLNLPDKCEVKSRNFQSYKRKLCKIIKPKEQDNTDNIIDCIKVNSFF